jgi:transposase
LIEKRIQELEDEVASLKAIIEKLLAENEFLRNGRRSKTSHTPSSQDIGRSNAKSLREKSDKSSGGQKDHQGRSLEMKEVADEVVDHIPTSCSSCGAAMAQVTSTVVGRRQEIVIPPILSQYVEHRVHSKCCDSCGTNNTGLFPVHLTAPIQYGSRVIALATYLSVVQYIPYRRICAMFKDMYNIHISEGSIDNFLELMSQKAMPFYEAIQERVQQSPVVGSDETGTPVAGKKGWFHTWQTKTLTFIVASMNRGYQTIIRYFADGFVASVYVSDCWAAQLKVSAKRHQLCLVHLLRDLCNFEEAVGCNWSIEMKALLIQAMELKKRMTGEQYKNPPPDVSNIEAAIDTLLAADSSRCHKRVKAFIKRLTKNRNAILTFLYYPDVPPHNNASEQSIRNIKVKGKVSGQFRSIRGAERFAILRSVVDTATKNAQDVFNSLFLLADFVPE